MQEISFKFKRIDDTLKSKVCYSNSQQGSNDNSVCMPLIAAGNISKKVNLTWSINLRLLLNQDKIDRITDSPMERSPEPGILSNNRHVLSS